MATLTAKELAEVRWSVRAKSDDTATDIGAISKPCINAMIQACEDQMQASKAGFVSAMESAASPYGYTPGNPIMKWIGAEIMRINFGKDIA